MDNNNWRLALPKREPDMGTDDWRAHLTPDSRQKIANNITEKLMKHLPFYGAKGMNEAGTIAATFEDEIFRGAVDQTDYLRKISMKMVTMETKWQDAAGSSSSSSFSVPEASKKLPLKTDNVNSKPLLTRAEAAVNTCDLTTQLPSDPRQNNANTTVQYMTGPSLPSREPAMTTYDWRTQLKPDSRERVVNKITETLQKHIPYSSPEEVRRIAVKFEEKIFRSAVNHTGYLRSISMKMLTMETRYQTAARSSTILPIAGAYKSLHFNPGCHQMTIEGPVNTGDWRTCLPPDSRKKNANKIKGTLKEHVPNCGKEGNKELKRIAVSFEELIFNTAIDQVDYFRKISFKIQSTKESD
ncbi:uncharacterized protein LOC103872373 isoform X2 [Brassica rapa]|uniref:uncharacterized protein LOC103872373 isoform X2 n=1 Tax=Brassica campestris TaxID=3711 RepID=UPI0004F1B9CC|nr:uncharacterized protein LOC103872373 isoform X2 [Brassica rapa]